jgi:23S rRNA-/tRNA-specific pseudouridylate synthase
MPAPVLSCLPANTGGNLMITKSRRGADPLSALASPRNSKRRYLADVKKKNRANYLQRPRFCCAQLSCKITAFSSQACS